MQAKTTLSSKGQVVIPKALREELGFYTGIEFVINLNANKLIELQPIRQDISKFFGMGIRKDKNHKKQHIIDNEIDQLIGKAVLENDRS